MDCCLCSSATALFRVSRYTICRSCYEGARCILALTQNMEHPSQADPERPKDVAQKGLANAFNQLKQMDVGLVEKYRFVEALSIAFQQEVRTDVELVPKDGPSIHAHKIVMATNSSVFRSMFEADECKEPHSVSVPFRDMDQDQLRCLMEFLYSGSLSEEKMQQHGHALFVAADKYDIPFLRKICQTHISNSVTPSNALEVLELATICSATSLKETAMNAIVRNQDEIIFSEKYEKFALKNALLSVEITKASLKYIKGR